MPQFPGFPSNDFDFHFEEAGGALAGLLMRDRMGNVMPGVLANSDTVLSAGSGWTIRVAPFVSARSKGRAVLLGGTTEEVLLDVAPAPSANSRIDVVYSLPADVGAGDPPVGVALATGLPGAAPVKPSIPVGAIEMGTFRTQAGHTGAANGTLTETYPFAALHGSKVKVRTKSALPGLNLMNGSSAYIMDESKGAELVSGEWISSKSSPFISPFSTYVQGTLVNVDVEDGMVTVSGTATTSRPGEISGPNERLFADVGPKYAPLRTRIVVMQGSGSDRWTLTVLTTGAVLCSRYGPGAPTSSVWLPFSITYPLKRS